MLEDTGRCVDKVSKPLEPLGSVEKDLVSVVCFALFRVGESSTAGNEANSFRFGLPTILCCPGLQGTLAKVHRTHL